MTAQAETEAVRLRRCRQTFELAMREGVPMPVAGQRLAETRWAEADARLAARRAGTELCGTAAPRGERPQFWYDNL